MRPKGNLPKIFKYHISRYGSSHDAEYKRATTSETMHSYSHERLMWKSTTNTPYPVFVISNQGFIGEPESGGRFEEDFRGIADADTNSTIRACYCILNTPTDQSREEWRTVHFLGDGTNLGRGTRDGIRALELFSQHQVQSGDYWFDNKRQRYEFEPGRVTTPNTSFPNLMTDGSISNAINTLGHFHNGNFVSDTFSFGNVSLVYGYNCYAGYVYDGGNRWFPCIKTPTGSIIDRDRYGGYLYVGTGSQPQQHHVSSHELFYVPPFSNLFSAENAKFVEGLNYTRAVGLYRSEICGRFVLSGNLLQYYDVENDVVLGYSFDMEPVQGYLHKIGFGSENHGATNFVSVRFGEHYSLLYKNMFLQEWTNNSASFCCFGSWYMDAGDKILRNAESGESIDLSGVLSETITGNVGSGIHGEMATYVSDSEHEEKPLMYIVSANSVFRLPWVGGHVTGNNLIYWPLPCHLRKIYFFYEQVVYVINKDGFTAYDMQTFLRLDDLPGFQSAVEKVWERA